MDDCLKELEDKFEGINEVEKEIAMILNIPNYLLMSEEMVRIDHSYVHGNGVFANMFIPKDHVFTFYPAHYIIISDPQNKTQIRTLDKSMTDISRCTIPLSKFKEYKFLIAGHPDDYNPSFCGHIINDRTNKLDNYDQESNPNCESVLLNNRLIGIRALRDIDEDEELFIKYGKKYWKNNL